VSPLAQRFAEAVRTLVGDGPIKQRLCRAYAENLEDLVDADFPPGLRAEFCALQASLSRVAPAGNVTRVRASVQKMSGGEAGDHAAAIVKLYVELMNSLERAEPLKVVSSTNGAPRYLKNRP
jgi:hypothetical protein